MTGLKAKSMLLMANEIFEEFMQIYNHFSEVPYDVLLPEETQFTEDLQALFEKVIIFY